MIMEHASRNRTPLGWTHRGDPVFIPESLVNNARLARNALVGGMPGQGKTTQLREVALQIALERGEGTKTAVVIDPKRETLPSANTAGACGPDLNKRGE